MGSRQAKRQACSLTAKLLHNYLDIGQPYDDCDLHRKGWIPEDADVLVGAIEVLIRELERRAGQEDVPNGY